jgi:hypothetical protein
MSAESYQKRPVTIGLVFAIVAAAIGVFGPMSVMIGSFYSLTTRVAVLEQQQVQTKEALGEIKQSLKETNSKLDKLLEKRI